MRDDLYATVTDFTLAIMTTTDPGQEPMQRLEEWEGNTAESIERARVMFEEVNRLDRDDMASLSVALRLLRSTVRS
jgi:glutamate dehydrogenase